MNKKSAHVQMFMNTLVSTCKFLMTIVTQLIFQPIYNISKKNGMTDSEYIFYIVEHFQTSVGILIEKKSIIEVTQLKQ